MLFAALNVNCVIDWLIRNASVGVTGVQVGITLVLRDVAYHEDIVILGESYEAVREMANEIQRYTNAVELQPNVIETEVLSAQVNTSINDPLNLSGKPLEEI